MAETLNIYQKLAKIRKHVEVMKRDTKAYGYNYVKEEDILAKITAFMDKYDLSLKPEIVPESSNVQLCSYKKTKISPKGEVYDEWVNEVLVSGDMKWVWLCNENPEERVVVPWFYVGQQSDASQSFGSGLTYSSRYFLLKYFNVATSNDDPDNWRSKQKEAETAEDMAIAAQIIGTLDMDVRQYLAANPNMTEEVKKFMTKNCKNGNYLAVKDSATASKLLEIFNKEFITKEIDT